jgi:hypothetical protein
MSNLTLSLIHNSKVGTAAYVPEEVVPTTPAPVPARRSLGYGAYSPKVDMSRPSDPQKRLIKDLLAEIATFDADQADVLRNLSNEAYFAGTLTPGYGNGASQHIDSLMKIRDDLRIAYRQEHRTTGHVRSTVPAGRYAVTSQEGHTAFYRVQVSDKGYYTVTHQVSDDFQPLPWAIQQGVLKQVEEAGVLPASIRYGQELGVCGVCGRTLTNPESIARGIGPSCASKMGG